LATNIGTLKVGKSADLVLLGWKLISYPSLDEETLCSAPSSNARMPRV
jgi:hypothetical protein